MAKSRPRMGADIKGPRACPGGSISASQVFLIPVWIFQNITENRSICRNSCNSFIYPNRLDYRGDNVKSFEPPPSRRKEKKYEEGIRRRVEGENEQASASNTHKPRTQIIFVNMGLGKQKTAKNFWVSLPTALNLPEIRKRVEDAFGDLDGMEEF